MTEKEKYFVVKTSTIWNALLALTFVFVLANIYMTNGLYALVSNGGIGSGVQPSEQPTIQPTVQPATQPTAQPNLKPVEIDINGDPFKGSEDAKVTIIEFSDFQCPFCQRFYSQTLPSIQSEYIDKGLVKFVYKDFPLASIHPQATKAAEAANCADDQGKFWEYHDIIFEKQNEWASLGASKFKDYASDLELDTTTFNNCLDSGKYADEVAADFQEGASNGIQGTPGFFVNGHVVSGAQPFSVFKQIIDAELAK